MSDLFIKNVWLMQRTRERWTPRWADVRIAEGRVADVRDAGHSHQPAACDCFDAEGRVATAPLVNFHDHCYSRLAKGLPAAGPSGSFIEILENLWWRLDRALDREMIRACAEQTALESIVSGVSYVFDHHSSPSCITGSLNVIAGVFHDYGLRGVLCYETSDRDGPNAIDAAVNENRSFAASANSDVRAMFGLHAPFTLSDGTLDRAAQATGELHLGIHSHAAEDKHDDRFNLDHYGKTGIARYKERRLLNERSIIAHGVHLSGDDRQRIAESGCGLACCPDSNMNNAVGIAGFLHFPEAIPLLAGTDGMHANVARTLKQLFLLFRHQGEGSGAAFSRMSKVFADQTAFVRKEFGDYPDLKTGDRADFTVWDYVPPAPINEENSIGHMIYGVLESRAHSVLSKGQFLMRNFTLTIPGEAERRAAIAKQGARLRRRFVEIGNR